MIDITEEYLKERIYEIRGQRVILDADLSEIYGYTTKEDLTKYSKFLMTGLITIIIISLINIFIKAPMLYWVGTILGVVIFSGLIAFDINRIKYIAYNIAGSDEEMVEKMGIIGALNLYLDFINLFLYLLRIFGKKRN